MPQQITQAQPPPTTHACPFVAGPMITNPSLFVGRKDALRTIASRMTGPQPTSINIVGKKRIGKSSLLYHFFQTWEQRVINPERYVVIYLSLQDADCRKEPDFYNAVVQELLKRPAVRNNTALATPLSITPLNRQTFSTAIEAWEAANVLPVLCLDKFEALLGGDHHFGHSFTSNTKKTAKSFSKPQGRVSSTVGHEILSFEERAKLVEHLLAIPSIVDRSRRATVILQLRSEIKTNVAYSSADKTHVFNIVETCLQYPNGMQELRDILQFFEHDSLPMQRFKEALNRLLPIGLGFGRNDDQDPLLDKQQDFPNDFYDNLRSLMNKNALMLVIASTEPVKQYAKKKCLTSDFFNIGQTEMLGLFTEEEVNELVSLPANTTQGVPATLGTYEQQQAREWGENHPYLLQLAGLCLSEANQQGKSIEWAKQRFAEQASNVPQPWFNRKKWWLPLRWLFVEPFVRLGRVIKGIGEGISTITDWLVGVAVFIAIGLGLLKVLSWSQIIEWLKGLFE